jgi:hypothetical protein
MKEEGEEANKVIAAATITFFQLMLSISP